MDMTTPRRAFKELAKRALRALHEAGLRIGLIVLPRHYYVPVADLRELRRTRKVWAKRSTLTGIAVNLDQQAIALRHLVLPWRHEYRDERFYINACARDAGPGYGRIEAMALHGMVRALKPRRIVEVGSGVSTAITLEADRLNRSDGDPGATITCVEPYPRPWLRSAPVELIGVPVQQAPASLFESLEAGDLLFLDSSHTVKTGGDVNLLVLEVLPRLAPGVIVHIHDIFLPYDFQRDADRTIFQWQETALVHAWLIGNREVEILFAMSMLHYDRPAALAEAFPGYRRQADRDGLACRGADAGDFPSSLWLRIGGSTSK
jgi:hypothetical protein